MYAATVAVISLIAFALAYRFYGTYLSRKVFNLDPDRTTPAHELEDGIDYVPTTRVVLFGHHFVSIAGLAPMLGPAIAVIWGWLPALIWVVLGTIFMGAVHDFAALYISIRNKGKSLGHSSDEIINPRARILFMLIIAFLVALAMGVFTFIIALLFVKVHPSAVIPVLSLMVIAVLVGVLTYRTKVGITGATIIGVILMFAFICVGMRYPVGSYRWFLSEQTDLLIRQEKSLPAPSSPGKTEAHFRAMLPGEVDASESRRMQHLREAVAEIGPAAGKAVTLWVWVLLGYAFVASIMPVWLLLQPRDYLNSFKLYLGLLLLFAGVFVSMATIKAPAINTTATDLPSIFPFLFITIACGAISGFHCVVSSGTSAKQLGNEGHAKSIGYGGMILEGVLAVAAVLACTAGFASREEWFQHYGSWKAAGGLTSKLNAFINGAAHLIESLGINRELAATFVAVVLVAFAMTSLDSGTRLLRYTFEELFTFRQAPGRPVQTHSSWSKKIACTLLAVVSMGFFALYKGSGLALWGLFGTTNQLLASFALLTATIYLLRNRLKVLPVGLPALFMFSITLTAIVINIRKFFQSESWALFTIGLILLLMSLWLLIEGIITIVRIRHTHAAENESSADG